MQLNSVLFLGFLAVVCVTAYLAPRKIRYVWLLVCSYAFYLYDAESFTKKLPAFALLLIATLLSYACARGIAASKKLAGKRMFLVISLVGTLGMLMTCKYLDFFLQGAGLFHTGAGKLNLVLPLGISYYTLQTVSYAIDVYTGALVPEKNPVRYALYISFFPGLVTGPINRAGEMLPQYTNPPKFSYRRVSGGLFRILWGLFKKMVIADNLFQFTSGVFKDLTEYQAPVVILAVLLFAYQLYMDFGGSCDIAIGAARMLGFKFTENFNRPFSAKTYPGLWQRWHISLTSFFRDYVFTPLVWSRWTEKLPKIGRFFTKPPVYSATIIVFTLSGLWHGANINYVIWGLLNGVLMALAQYTGGKKREKFIRKVPVYRNRYLRGAVQRTVVYLLFSFCLVFFLAAIVNVPAGNWFTQVAAGGWDMLGKGELLPTFDSLGLNAALLWVLAGSAALVEALEKLAVKPDSTIASWIRGQRFFVRWPLYYALLFVLFVFAAFGKSPFIYQAY